MRALLLAAACVVSTLAFVAPASAQTAEPDRLTIILDWYVNPNHGPLIIAEEQGYFADKGLEVEIIAPADPSTPPKIVAAGGADLAIWYQPQLHLQVDQGLPLTRVGTLIATPLNCLMVRADSPVQSVADLKGGSVGYSVAGVEEALMTAMLAEHGLTLDDIEMINVNWALTPAVMTGQVDAVIGAYRNFELTQIRLQGVDGRCLFIEEHGVPMHDELIFVANSDKLAENAAHAAAIARFIDAVERATHYIVNHPQETWETFSGTSAELEDELNERAWFDTLPRFALRPHAFDAGRYDAFAAFLAEADLIAAPQSAAALAVDLRASAE